MSFPFELAPSRKRQVSVRATLETGMILTGVVATLFLLPRRGFYDGNMRFTAICVGVGILLSPTHFVRE